jgi:hypothetical protein
MSAYGFGVILPSWPICGRLWIKTISEDHENTKERKHEKGFVGRTCFLCFLCSGEIGGTGLRPVLFKWWGGDEKEELDDPPLSALGGGGSSGTRYADSF